MKQVRLHFCDFWTGFNPNDNFIQRELCRKFQVVVDAVNPEIVFFSCFGRSHLEYDCTKVFFTGENVRPDFNLCDYAIGFDRMEFGDRYFRFPIFAFEDIESLKAERRNPVTIDDIQSRLFCNFIYSNANADPVRDKFFNLLNKFKNVDSLGQHLRNTTSEMSPRYSENWAQGKQEMLSNYNFTIAFENSSSPGYITEKISHAFRARSIPIYYGDPDIKLQFNINSFINAHDFTSLEDCARYVYSVSDDPDKMANYLNATVFPDDYIPESIKARALAQFLSEIAEQSPGDRNRRPKYGRTAFYLFQMKRDKEISNLIDIVATPLRRLRSYFLNR
jgi:hypothetical protein